MQFFGIQVIFKRIKSIRFMMSDKAVPKRKKLIIILGIVYLFLPIDLIPPILIPIGFLDDIVLWIFILWYLRKELDQYWMGKDSKDYSKKYRGKTILDDVEYTVDKKDDSEDSDETTDEWFDKSKINLEIKEDFLCLKIQLEQ